MREQHSKLAKPVAKLRVLTCGVKQDKDKDVVRTAFHFLYTGVGVIPSRRADYSFKVFFVDSPCC
jgi:hypothetical protein